MMANPILLQKKYSRVIECFAKVKAKNRKHCSGNF